MAYLKVYSHNGGTVLDVQSDYLERFSSRVVVPLVPVEKGPQIIARLNPVFVIGDVRVMMLTEYLAAVPISSLKEQLADLSHARDDVTAALDLLLHGF